MKQEYLHEVFRQVGAEVLASARFAAFFRDNEDWLVPYAAFCVLRDRFGTADFRRWPEYAEYRAEEIRSFCRPSGSAYGDITYYYYVQFCLHEQLSAASSYARAHRVVLKGDIPIGISRDSVEACGTLLLQSGRAGRCAARRFLRERAELGFPHLQLGRDAERRVQLVGAPFPQDGRIFRCLSHRPRIGLLPDMGDSVRRRAWLAGLFLPVAALERGRDRGVRTGVPRGRSSPGL